MRECAHDALTVTGDGTEGLCRVCNIRVPVEMIQVSKDKWFYFPEVRPENRTTGHPSNDPNFFEVRPRVWIPGEIKA